MWLERVILWALVEGPNTCDCLEAITSNGMPLASLGDRDGDYFYVKCSDGSPIPGQTWGQLYDATTPTPFAVHELAPDIVKLLFAAGR